MGKDTVKTFVSFDGQRRVKIFRRHDGFFSFEEDQWTSELEKPCWVSAAHHGVVSICDSAETAEREARARIDWLIQQVRLDQGQDQSLVRGPQVSRRVVQMSNLLRVRRRRHRRRASRPGRLLLSCGTTVVVAALVGAAYYFIVERRNAPRVIHGMSATAVDGDSLRVDGWEIRLIGIDAPELLQTCRDEHDRQWACGREAHAHLGSLISRGSVNCATKSKDQFGRTLATCSVDTVGDIGAAMVRAGYAVNFMNGDYKAAEAEARAASRGIWRGSFEWPQDWRRREH